MSNSDNWNQIDTHYEKIIQDIKSSGRTRLNYAAYVMFSSTYSADGIFQLMLQNKDSWNPKIVIIPDISRGDTHKNNLYSSTKADMINKYGPEYVLDGYNIETNEYYDYVDEFDIICYNNPYDLIVHDYHKICYGASKNVLTVLISYGYDISYYYTSKRLSANEYNYVWKCFTDTTYSMDNYRSFQARKGANVVLAGYAKMDAFAQYDNKINKGQKKILIASHHTVTETLILPLSTFMDNHELFLQLPVLFPDVKFIFRPHPLLFTTLVIYGIWSQEEVDNYLNELQSLGVEYSFEPDYFHLFAECDAIINDCGSFTVEWLFTGKPGCFMVNKLLSNNNLTNLAQAAVSEFIQVTSWEEIIEFVKIIASDDYYKNTEMNDWVRENIAINYPNASKKVLDEIDILK